MKKIIALILVVVLSFGVCSISFASGIEDDNNDYSWELSQIEGAPKIECWKSEATASPLPLFKKMAVSFMAINRSFVYI